VTNSRTGNPDSFSNEEFNAMAHAMGSVQGSPTDLYPQYPSPNLPPRTQ